MARTPTRKPKRFQDVAKSMPARVGEIWLVWLQYWGRLKYQRKLASLKLDVN